MSGWSDEELAAALAAYKEMARRHEAGEPLNKREIYRHLAQQHGRTEDAFEYRMQNISAVLQADGQDWIPGLKPAGNVGANIKARILALLQSVEPGLAPMSQTPQVDTESLSPTRKTTQATIFARDPAVVREAKERASDGRCECCGELGFETDAGGYYLEVHHVVPLNCGGPDVVWNVAAICSNDHRRAHFARERTEIRDHLIRVLGERYPSQFDQLQSLARAMDALPNVADQLEAEVVT